MKERKEEKTAWKEERKRTHEKERKKNSNQHIFWDSDKSDLQQTGPSELRIVPAWSRTPDKQTNKTRTKRRKKREKKRQRKNERKRKKQKPTREYNTSVSLISNILGNDPRLGLPSHADGSPCRLSDNQIFFLYISFSSILYLSSSSLFLFPLFLFFLSYFSFSSSLFIYFCFFSFLSFFLFLLILSFSPPFPFLPLSLFSTFHTYLIQDFNKRTQESKLQWSYY